MTALIEPEESPATIARRQRHQGWDNLVGQALKESPQAAAAVMRYLAQNDLFYLAVKIGGRVDMDNDWCMARCDMVQADPFDHVDLWPRYHYKTSIGSWLIIQDILNDPEVTILVLSYNKDFAHKVIRPVMLELEKNQKLKELFSHILWENPKRDADKWAVATGFSVIRKENPKEQTVEGYGLVDSLPTGVHPRILHYEDCETDEAVGSSDSIWKLINAWELSLGLAAANLIYECRKRYYGTYYHHAGLYKEMIRRGLVKERKFHCTVDNIWPGTKERPPIPVFLSLKKLQAIAVEMGTKNFNAQMRMDPTPSDTAMFRQEMLQFWKPMRENLNIYILVDPANLKRGETRSQKKAMGKADYTGMWVLGLGSDRNYYVLEIVRDKLTKNEKLAKIFELADKYEPLMVYWYGGAENSDVSDIRTKQTLENFRFPISEVSNAQSIRKELIPDTEGIWQSRRVFLPDTQPYRDWQGNMVDLVQVFINDEFLKYPFCIHEDMLSAFCMVKHKDVREDRSDKADAFPRLRFPNRGEVNTRGYKDPKKNQDSYEGYDVLEDGLSDRY